MALRDPQPLAIALSELIALRGFARVRSDNELELAWKQVAGPEIASHTRPLAVNRGTLTVYVDNAPLLSELASFQSSELLLRFKRGYTHLKIKTLKFKLNGT